MKFYYKPKEAIIQSIVNKVTDQVNRYVVCVFDDNGELETNDEKIIYILQNKLPECTWDEGVVVDAMDVADILSDDDIRALAKEKGIKHWHNKKIENLKKELGV